MPVQLSEREPIPFEAVFLRAYRQRGGIRTSPLPDFFISAHATVAGYDLLTRDAGRYGTCFPTVRVIGPG